MPVTTQASPQAKAVTDKDAARLEGFDGAGKLRAAYFLFTQSGQGDANSTADLVWLPAGRLRIYGHLSRINWDALGASRTAQVGYGAYTKPDGTAVAAAPTGLLAATAAAAAGGAALTPVLLIESTKPVLIQALIAAGTLDDTKKLEGCIVYAID